MTTIAYKDGVIAGDTLKCTGFGIRSGHVIKVVEKDGWLLGCAGCSMTNAKVRDWMMNGREGDCPTGDIHMLLVPPEGPALLVNDDGESEITAPFFAIGSGADLALGAMAFGATAEEAVRVAIELDTHSGGSVTVLRRPDA